jgi:hypothetical protein
MAPVTTTGRGSATVRSRKYAVSSIVSVPCVTTTPASSGCARSVSAIPRASASHIVGVMADEATLANCCALTVATVSSAGTARSSCATPILPCSSPGA